MRQREKVWFVKRRHCLHHLGFMILCPLLSFLFDPILTISYLIFILGLRVISVVKGYWVGHGSPVLRGLQVLPPGARLRALMYLRSRLLFLKVYHLLTYPKLVPSWQIQSFHPLILSSFSRWLLASPLLEVTTPGRIFCWIRPCRRPRARPGPILPNGLDLTAPETFV